jgi:quercetin dioxygenase-like cupin family protein
MHFTGAAFVNMLIADTGNEHNCHVYNVDFETRARNNWHKRPCGQLSLVTDGKGCYQERGKTARLLRKGDVVAIPLE